MNTSCLVCGSEREESFRATVMGKYDVRYFICATCGLLQTESPYWLSEAYSDPIADADTGLLARNYNIASTLAVLLYSMFGKGGKYLDIAGGYGVLTRLMRDYGYDYYWNDEYSQNVFAKGFELVPNQKPYVAVTAFEVFEHLYDPISFIQKWVEEAGARTIIFSTELFEREVPKQDWWYYAFATGQHISFYQRRTLEWIGSAMGLRLYSHGNWHMLTEHRVSALKFRVLTSRYARRFSWYPRARLGSRTMFDHHLVSSKTSTGST